MIAPREISLPPAAPSRVHVRGRDAARRRARRARLNGYALLARIALGFVVLLFPIMIYVLLMGNLTALNYTLAHATEQRMLLQDETTRLDDRIAQLQSRDRLADLAVRMHMHDPDVYAVVTLPHPAVTPPAAGIAFIGAFFHR